MQSYVIFSCRHSLKFLCLKYSIILIECNQRPIGWLIDFPLWNSQLWSALFSFFTEIPSSVLVTLLRQTFPSLWDGISKLFFKIAWITPQVIDSSTPTDNYIFRGDMVVTWELINTTNFTYQGLLEFYDHLIIYPLPPRSLMNVKAVNRYM